jgi:hypothetical protein
MFVRQADRTAKTGNSTRADYRPVLSYILNDYMFRCPTWRAAHLLQEKSQPGVDVYVFQFSHPTRVSPASALFRAHVRMRLTSDQHMLHATVSAALVAH